MQQAASHASPDWSENCPIPLSAPIDVTKKETKYETETTDIDSEPISLAAAQEADPDALNWQKYDCEEEILTPNPHRWVLFPIKYKMVHAMYKKHVASFWPVEEVPLDQDEKDWITLSVKEKHFIKHVLAFFAASDGIVMENLAGRFLKEVQIPEARNFYACQIFMESVHTEMYSLLIDTYVKDKIEKKKLLESIETIPSIAAKAEWAARWISSSKSFAHRLVAYAAVEGIFFSGSFCAIFWLKKRNKMKEGLGFSNELISRDEGLHTDFACLLYSMLKYKLPKKVVYQIIREAVLVEKQFVCESLPVDLIGMNSKLMSQYIEFVADRLIDALGYEKLWNTPNPFEWMEVISLQGKTNFFEQRNGDYQKAKVMATTEKTQTETLKFDDEDF